MDEKARQAIDRFYQPRTVAMIGVSSRFSFGFGLPRFLIDQGWGDRSYPVNPNVKEIAGIRAYPSVLDIPEDIELACILVPAPSIGKSRFQGPFQRPGKGRSRHPLRCMSGEASDGRVYFESSERVLSGS